MIALSVITVGLLSITCAFIAKGGDYRKFTWLKKISGYLGVNLIVYGFFAFIFSMMSAIGVLNWFPDFQWPIAFADGIKFGDNEFVAIAHPPSGRVQLYDKNWKYIEGWRVGAKGGTFKFIDKSDDSFTILTARGDKEIRFQISEKNEMRMTHSPDEYDKHAKVGGLLFVPIPVWLIGFAHPLFSVPLAVAGMVLADFSRNRSPKSKKSNNKEFQGRHP